MSLLIRAAIMSGVITCLVTPSQAQYKYNFKLGPEQYNYDVTGQGYAGQVAGNVDTHGRYVEGTLETEDGEEVRFEGEWTDWGVIEGYDENGDYYELEVE